MRAVEAARIYPQQSVTMRLAVFSDIHGNLTALEAMLDDFGSVDGVDLIWILGDLAAFGPRPEHCIRRIRDFVERYGKDKVKVIGGNTDRYLVTGERMKSPIAKDEEQFRKMAMNLAHIDTTLNWNLAQLSWEDYQFLSKILYKEIAQSVDHYGYVIGYHAIPGNDEIILGPGTPDEEATDALLDREGQLGIGGHIHIQMDRDLGGWRIVNVGSVGMSFDMPGRAQWGLFTFTGGDVAVDLRAVAYDTRALIADFEAAHYPLLDWAITRMKLT